MSKLTKTSLTGSVALGLALLVAGSAAAQAAWPNANSQISGWCSATEIGDAVVEDSWNVSDATGAPVTDSQGLSYSDGMGHDAFASGADRRVEIAWYMDSSERGPDALVGALWWRGGCGDYDSLFSNTFTVVAAEGSGLNADDVVFLESNTRLKGQLWVGSVDETLALGGGWTAYGEVGAFVELRTETGEWLAETSLWANTDAVAWADKPGDADGSVDHRKYLEWSTESNWVSYDDDWSEQQKVVCAAFSSDTGCYLDPSDGIPAFDGFYIDEEHTVVFRTEVGARVTLTAWLPWIGHFEVFQQGNGANLPRIYSDGNFRRADGSIDPRGLSTSVRALTAGAEIVWDVGSTPPPPPLPEVFIEAHQSLDEGDAGTRNMWFRIALSKASDTDVTVRWATSGITAQSGADYQESTGLMTFSPGEIVKDVAVAIVGDTDHEADEIFTFNLWDPTGATLGSDEIGVGSQARGTIVNDDPEDPGVPVQISALQGQLAGLAISGSLQHALGVKLATALAAFEAGDLATACDKMTAFINQTKAKSGKGISPATAAALIAEAESIKAAMGC